MEEPIKVKKSFSKTLGAQFMTGLLAILPLAISIWILVWLFNAIDDILQPVILRIWDKNLPGVGFGVTIILIFLIGVFARNVIGRRIMHWGDSLLDKVPVFRFLYRSIRQILTSFSTTSSSGFMQVVIVDFPTRGMKTIGFITNEIIEKSGEKSLCIFIPNAPNPMTGFLQIYQDADVLRTKITVDEAMKWVVSVGTMMPEEFKEKL